MKNWQITGFLAILALGFLLMSGCTTTPQPASTAQPTSALKTVLFSDDLSQWRSEWDAVSETSDGKIFYSGGSLHIRDNNPLTETTVQRLNKNYNDFILDIDTKLVGGSLDNWQGLYFRHDDADNYYGAAISADGYSNIAKFANGNRQDIAGPTRSSYINTGVGATNHIHLEANKNTISLSVNGHLLSTVTDNSFKEGNVKLVANCMTSNSFTEVSFNNLVITTI
jgi:hypothetical protein